MSEASDAAIVTPAPPLVMQFQLPIAPVERQLPE
jgi:hypothetical protein